MTTLISEYYTSISVLMIKSNQIKSNSLAQTNISHLHVGSKISL